MSATASDAERTGPAGYAGRIARNEAALERYRAERADRAARGVRTRTSERVITRLEAETELLRTWAGNVTGGASAR
jgi:hypothetical protein